MLKQVLRSKYSVLVPALVVSMLGVYGWVVKQLMYSAFFIQYVPMAPATACFFILLILVLFIPTKRRNELFYKILCLVIAGVLSLFSIALILEYSLSLQFGLSNLGKDQYDLMYASKEQIGQMSPITAFLFLLICLILAIPLLTRKSSWIYIRRVMILVVFLASFILLTGYLYQAPLLYGSGIIPVALPTAVCFFLIGISYIQEEGFPFVNPHDNSVRYRLLRSFLPLVIIFVVFQGFLLTNVFLRAQNPTLISALLLFIALLLSSYFIRSISGNLGSALQKAEEELLIRNARIQQQNDQLHKMNAELDHQRTKAEESDRLKSAFLANMSHEIRTPMNGILGFADLLQQQHLTQERQAEYLHLIKKSGERLLSIINDIIDVSRIEAGQVHVIYSTLNLEEQLKYIYAFFKPEADRKGISLTVTHTLSPTELYIKTDEEKLYAILINLIKNALKFTREGSIRLVCERNDKVLEFRVEDTGIGIPDDRISAVFERFIQADVHEHEARQGTGLGLAICKAYVELLGGKIWVKSKKGSGSTFWFTLPCLLSATEVAGSAGIQSHIPAPDCPPLRNVLIVEDDEASADLLLKAMENCCEEISCVESGMEALHRVKNTHNLDLVLLDIGLPDMDGLQVARKIRAHNQTVIIIAQTAYGLEGDKEKALEAGCNDYLSKPLNTKYLFEIIHHYFHS